MRKRLVSRILSVFLSAVMVFSDVTPAFAADKTVSVNETVVASESEELLSEETEDASSYDDASIDEINEDVDEIIVEEDSNNTETDDIIVETVSDGAGAGTTYDVPPSNWCNFDYIAYKNNSSNINQVHFSIYSNSSTLSRTTAPSSAYDYKLLIYGSETSSTANLDSDTLTTIKGASARWHGEGTNGASGYTIEQFLPYVNTIAIRNLNGIDAISDLLTACSSCKEVIFCDETSSTSAKTTKKLSSLPGTPFAGRTKLQSVTLPACVTSLSTGYFNGCTALTSVTGISVTSIPANCFYGCTSLTSIPAAVTNATSVGADAFRGCTKLTSIPTSATTIGNNAFYGCTGLTSANLGNCSSIGSQAFRGTNISSLTLKSGCSVGDYAFYGTKIASINVSGVSLGTGVFQQCTSLKTVTCNTFDAGQFTGCPLTTVNIGASGTLNSALSGFASTLTSVNAPNITVIGNSIFKNCTKLSSMTFGTLSSVGSEAFYGCTSLTQDKINLAGLTSIGANAFCNTGITKVVLGSGITSWPNAFTGCKLTSITIPGITAIPALTAFKSTLTEVIANGATSVGASAFSNCTLLNTVTMPKVTTVGESAFSNCPKITQSSIDLSKLTSIGLNAFQNTGITKVVLGSGIISWPNAFGGCGLTSITIPGIQAIPALTAFKSTLTEVVANGATSVGASAFTGCTLLNTVTIPNVKTVGESAFSNCTKITQSNLDISKFTSIGLNAFQNTGITQVTLNSALTDFPNAFSGCNLTSVTMPGAETIGTNKFSRFKTTLTTIDGENVTSLGESAFDGCTALKNVNLPKLKTIGKGSFRGCTALSAANYDSVETIGDEAFQGCTGITSITFAKAKTIGASAFEGCSNLTTLALDTVSTIEENAFANCPIKALSLEHILTIGQGAFSGCTQLKSASIETATTIYKNAFYGCENLGNALSLRDVTLIEENAFNGIGTALDSQSVITIPSTKNISIGNGAFNGNLAYVTYDGTEEDWNNKISLGSTQKDVFGDAYILFNDGKKLYPNAPTGGTGEDNPTITPGTDDPTGTPDGPTEPPTPETPSGTPTNPTTPTDPSTPSDGTLSEEDIENLIKKIIEIVIPNRPDPNDADAVQKWLDDIKEIAEKYNIDVEALINKALENLDNPTELEKVIDQIINKFKETVKDTVNTLVDTVPQSTDSKELIEWWLERVKEWAKENGYTDLKNLTNDALDDIDDETKRAEYLEKILDMLKDIQKDASVSPTPTPAPTEPTDGEEDPSLTYYDVVFYYYDKAPKVYTEKVVAGGSVINAPETKYEGSTFMGWYEVNSLATTKPVRWHVGTPVYKDIMLSALFMTDEGTIKVVIPDTDLPIKGDIDVTNLPSAEIVSPKDVPAITNLTFNILPSRGGFGDLSASGLDGFIDFGSIEKNNTNIYMVKGQKVIDASVNMTSADKKVLKVSKDGQTIQAKKDGVTSLSVTNRLTGATYKASVYVVTPKMSSKKLTVKTGQTTNATITCGSLTSKYPIYWTSSNVDVVYVEASSTHGMAIVHGIGKGSAVITAYVNGKAYKCSVKVSDTAKISSAAGVLNLIPLETVDIAKSGLNGMDGFNTKDATWTYSNPGVVSIDAKGMLKATGYGTTTVTGVAKDGARKAFTVNVTSAMPGTVHINMGQAKSVKPYKVPVKQAVWTSSNPEIATVNEKGKINAHQAGATLITAKYMGYTYRYYVYVENPTLVNTSNLSGSGKKYSLGVDNRALTQLAVTYADQPVVFISKKPEIVFVDENGFVRGRSAGVADITTKINKLSINIKTTVF